MIIHSCLLKMACGASLLALLSLPAFAAEGHPAPPPRPPEFGTASHEAPDEHKKETVKETVAPVTPQPPSRPSTLSSATTPATGATSAVPPTPSTIHAAVSSDQPLSDRAIVERVNAYFNAIATLSGDFVQYGADGRRSEGRLTMQRPGRLRFDYSPPATIDVVADGRSVAIRDRKLNTQDLLTIGQTPLKFLLQDRIDIARDSKIVKITTTSDVARVTLEDSATLGGTSRITLVFDPKVNHLSQWTVVDPQGFETTVRLANLETNRAVDPSVFRINYERLIDTQR